MENIENLLSRRLIDLEGRDFVALAQYAGAIAGSREPVAAPQAIGISALADALSCSVSQIYNLNREHLLDDAVISHIGRRIVYDVNKAREAANNWMASRKNN